MLYTALILASTLVSASTASLCPPLAKSTTAQTVTTLRPTDFGLLLALGDSITAGFGIDNEANEHRGASFSIGGDLNYTGDLDQDRHQLEGAAIYSLPNLFRQYNSNVKGFSVGVHAAEFHGSAHDNATDVLNAAQSSAVVQDLASQIDYIVDRIMSGDFGAPETVIKETWKHMNIFIGANNLCGSCSGDDSNSPDTFQSQLEAAIEQIYAKLPRTVISLTSLPKFSKLRNLEPSVSWCALLHEFYAECSCIFKSATDADRAKVDANTEEYNLRLRATRQKWADKQLDDFAVLLHPYNEDIVIPSEDYVSTLDCFHPSRLAHQDFAIATWNSLFLPFSQKSTAWDFKTALFCPTEDSLIRLD